MIPTYKLNKIVTIILLILTACIFFAYLIDDYLFSEKVINFIKSKFTIYLLSLLLLFIGGLFGFIREYDVEIENDENIIFYKRGIFLVLIIELLFSMASGVKSASDVSTDRLLFLLSPTILFLLSRPLKRLSRIEKLLEELLDK